MVRLSVLSPRAVIPIRTIRSHIGLASWIFGLTDSMGATSKYITFEMLFLTRLSTTVSSLQVTGRGICTLTVDLPGKVEALATISVLSRLGLRATLPMGTHGAKRVQCALSQVIERLQSKTRRRFPKNSRPNSGHQKTQSRLTFQHCKSTPFRVHAQGSVGSLDLRCQIIETSLRMRFLGAISHRELRHLL